MSLILQGIDMPIETDYLRLALFRSGRDNEVLVFDDATNTLIGEAIQIPKGHGKIGDLDALAEEIREKDIMGGLNYERYIKDVPTILGEEKE